MEKYEVLTQTEGMWAKMLMDVLRENGIRSAAFPIYGAGFTIKTGMQERLKVYVPEADKPRAWEIMEAFFSELEKK